MTGGRERGGGGELGRAQEGEDAEEEGGEAEDVGCEGGGGGHFFGG